MATYFPDSEYHARVETLLCAAPLLNIEPCPFAGCVTKDGIMLALGEKLDVWPASIREMAKRY
jgi:hypothetical protein